MSKMKNWAKRFVLFVLPTMIMATSFLAMPWHGNVQTLNEENGSAVDIRVIIDPPNQKVFSEEMSTNFEASYKVWNLGGDRLVLGEPSASCGCSVVSLEPRVVDPGQHAQFKVTGTAPIAGERTIEVRLPTNHSGRDLIARLTVVGSGKPPIVLGSPESVQIGTIQINSSHEPESIRIQTLELESSPPGLGQILSTPSGLSIRGGLASEEASGNRIVAREYEYFVKIKSASDTGFFSQDFVVGNLSNATSFSRKINVNWTVKPRLYSVPEKLYLAFESGTTPPGFSFMIVVADPNHKLRIEPDAETSRNFQITREPLSDSKIRFVLNPKRRVGSDGTSFNLKFHTNCPDVPSVLIPILYDPR